MQIDQKSYENVWILSGTSDGPSLAQRFLKLNYVVFVTVVSYKASKAYQNNPKLHIITGKLSNEKVMKEFIIKNRINYIVDATHPFALEVSENLYKACREISKSIFKFDRNDPKTFSKSKLKIISDLKGISSKEVKNKNLLLAIGSRSLKNVANHYRNLNANVFARIIATPESISKALSSGIKNSNIAILNPTKNLDNCLESYLCKKWEIDIILCRNSGGYSQMIWEKVSEINNLKLFLLKRPAINSYRYIFSGYDELVEKIAKTK